MPLLSKASNVVQNVEEVCWYQNKPELAQFTHSTFSLSWKREARPEAWDVLAVCSKRAAPGAQTCTASRLAFARNLPRSSGR